MKIELVRDTFGDTFTLGKLYVDNVYFGETCEDVDRHLETGGEKVHGQTAIPRGLYAVDLTWSHRFKKLMPEVHSVPGFSGVRIHGGNTAADTEGCPLLGKTRTPVGVANCAERNATLIHRINVALDEQDDVTLEVR